MDSTYSCFFIFVFVVIILVVLFRCKLKCGACDSSKSENYDFLPTEGKLPTGEGGYLLEGDSLGKFDYVDNETCMQCQRDFSNTRVCAQYCIRGFVI